MRGMLVRQSQHFSGIAITRHTVEGSYGSDFVMHAIKLGDEVDDAEVVQVHYRTGIRILKGGNS